MHPAVEALRRRRVHVVGVAGQEGYAIIRYLVGKGFRGLVAHDLSADREALRRQFISFHQSLGAEAAEQAFAALLAMPIELRLGDAYLEGVEEAEVVFVPQSWHRYEVNQPLRRAQAAGVRLKPLIHLFFELAPCSILGVTGTCGKSTTVALLRAMLLAAGREIYSSGNDRANVWSFERLEAMPADGLVVLEISNRQLMDMPYSPRVGVITNLSPHHLDEHPSFEHYVATKANLIRHQRSGDVAVLNADCPATHGLAGLTRGSLREFSVQRAVSEGAFLRNAAPNAGTGAQLVVREEGRETPLMAAAAVQLPGLHNLQNVLAAALAARAVGAPWEAIRRAVAAFTGLEHRLSPVRTLHGVAWIEDSQSTDPVATIAAIRSFAAPKVLIAGGSSRTATLEGYLELGRALADGGVRAAFLIGDTAPQMAEAFARAAPDVPVRACVTLDQAVEGAARTAVAGDVVVLSPGCESFGMFRDYRDRAERFRALVAAL